MGMNNLAVTAVSTVLLASAPTAFAALDEATADAIITACERLMADYAVYRDRLDADGWAATFTEDAVLVLGSGTYEGRDAILENLASRPTPAVAHLIMLTSVKITPIDETSATGTSYAIILNGDRPVGPGDPPIQMEGITSVNVYHTEFVLTADGWRISRMELEPVFRGPGLA